MKILTYLTALIFSGSVLADEVVSVPSLEVKERIQSMEQVNVSAPTEKQAEAPSTNAVAELLEEATEIEAEAEADQEAD